MLDVIGSILVGMALAVALTALTTTLPLRISGRFVLAGTAGAWIGLAGAVAGMGALSNPPTVLAMFGTPLVIMVGLAFGVPAVRRALTAIPLPLLIALNIVRLAGVLFVLLAVAGRLSGPFPYFAGWGDFATGALALPVATLAASETRFRDRLILAWNSFGMLDLIVAVTLGMISRNGSPLQLIHAGVGTAALQTLPWAFIPTVLVPFFLAVHAIVFAQLRARSSDKVGQPPILSGELGRAH
ncbi:MAG TPA: hypothetical protein VLV50_10545 [Stellaceae bacterium]|jgi:hypothetical protein|nr:hypothetical protein [Stellaceae bacterium]